MPNIAISAPSVSSLLLNLEFNGQPISSATGFVVFENNTHYLITDWHVVSGRNAITNENLDKVTAARPEQLTVMHNMKESLGTWTPKTVALYDVDDNPLWKEHPTFGRQVDVVALPILDTTGIELYPHNLNCSVNIAATVSQNVSIVGFPYGRTGGGHLGIWSQGAIASEPMIDYENLPLFLIDSRTRRGQSGSPVILHIDGGAVPMEDGSTAIMAGPVTKLLGVYSGRISEESDLGRVWKASVIQEIIDS